VKWAILIHGWGDREEFYRADLPTASNSHWFLWLTKQLMIRDIHTVALEMPNSYYPEYGVWKRELERFEVDEDTVLVGHSCGAGFIVRYLSEEAVKVGKVVLVAPWIGVMEGGEDFDEGFFDFEIDGGLVEKTAGVTLMESSNDMRVVNESVEILKRKIEGMRVVTIEGAGHFCKRDGYEEFEELLEEVLR